VKGGKREERGREGKKKNNIQKKNVKRIYWDPRLYEGMLNPVRKLSNRNDGFKGNGVTRGEGPTTNETAMPKKNLEVEFRCRERKVPDRRGWPKFLQGRKKKKLGRKKSAFVHFSASKSVCGGKIGRKLGKRKDMHPFQGEPPRGRKKGADLRGPRGPRTQGRSSKKKKNCA